MFRFASGHLLLGLLLVPVLAIFLAYAIRSRHRALELFAARDLADRLAASVNRRGRWAKGVLLVFASGFLILAQARPQFGSRIETVQSRGQDVMVALDVSLSMLAEDVPPNRIERARLEIGRLISGLRGDRVGLVAFAGRAFVQSPLTSDYGAATMFLRSMDTDLIPVQGTNLGEALLKSLEAFEESPRDHRILVVVTDGEDHEGQIDEAVSLAIEAGVTIHTVGIGSTEGVPIPEFDANGVRRGFKRDDDGVVVTTRLEEGPLRRIAEATGGRYVRAAGGAAGLEELVDEILAADGQELEARQITRFEEQYQIFLGVALVLLLIEVLVPDRRRVQEAWTGRFK